MTQSESERQRLARTYAEMSDAALLELAADAASLTDIAKDVLRAELSIRSLDVPTSLAGNAPTPEPPPAISGPLVMVKRFRDLPQAFVAKSILDSAGLDSFLADENFVRIDWLYSNLIGGAKLLVRSEDLAEATELLNEAANEKSGNSGETASSSTSGDTTA